MLAASFWSNFWPGLIAGLVSGVLTSVVAGVVVYRLQIRWEQRETETTTQRDLDHVLARLRLRLPRGILRYPDYTKASTTLPTNLDEAADLIVGQPVHQWREILPAQSQLIEACTNYLEYYETFTRTAEACDDEIGALIDSPWRTEPIDRVHAFLVADALEDPRLADRDVWLSVRSGAPADRATSLREDANKVKVDARYAPAMEPFVKARTAVEEAAATMRGALDVRD